MKEAPGPLFQAARLEGDDIVPCASKAIAGRRWPIQTPAQPGAKRGDLVSWVIFSLLILLVFAPRWRALAAGVPLIIAASWEGLKNASASSFVGQLSELLLLVAMYGVLGLAVVCGSRLAREIYSTEGLPKFDR